MDRAGGAKRLIAMVLLGLLLFPAPADAKTDKDSAKEWVEDRSEKKQRDMERRARKQRLRRDARNERKSKDKYESKYKFKYESKYKYEAKYKYKYKYEAKDKHRSGRDKHHGHGGYGLVYGGRREHRHRHGHGLFHSGHRPYRPRPHPCDYWSYDGRPYHQVGYHDDDYEFWHYDDSWRPCGHGRPRSIRSTYVVHLSGDQVVPQPGPADASGVANLLFVRNRHGAAICYRLSLRGTDTSAPLQVDLHAVGRPGPPIFDLNFAANRFNGCQSAPPERVREIERRPGSYYLDVHTQTHDAGVVRGVLVRAYKS